MSKQQIELKPCPFCGSKEKPFITPYNNGRKWNLDHYCPHTEDDEITVVINIYGNSYEEVVELWNRRVDNEQREAD